MDALDSRKKRILLIEPPFYRLYNADLSLVRAPLSLGYLSCSVRRNTDWSVMVYNADFNPRGMASPSLDFLTSKDFACYMKSLNDLEYVVWDEVKETIKDFNPSVVGITSKSQNFKSASRVAEIAKNINNDALVVVGGPHPSMTGKEVLGDSNIDVAVKGEGEITIIELINAFETGIGFHDIQGIYYKNEGQIIENSSRAFIPDLDTLCFPHDSLPDTLKDYSKYPRIAFRSIFATRGCPFNCSFCGSKYIWSRKVRFRSTDSIIQEIKKLQACGLKNIFFEDDTFGVNKQYIHSLCDAIIQNCPNITWGCEINIKLLDSEVVSRMKKSGCNHINIGIESGNNDMLKRIRKNISIEEAFEACKLISSCGIDFAAFFIIGFPEESEESIEDTKRAIKKVFDYGGDVIFNIFTPYPGTEMFEFCKEKGLVDDNFDVSLYNHQSPKNNFTLNISNERFREITEDVVKMIDAHNRKKMLQILFSRKALVKLQEMGFILSFKRFLKTLIR